MQSAPTPPPGQLLQTFRYSRALPIALNVFGAVLLALAALVAYLQTVVPNDTSGPVTLHSSRGMDLTFSSQAAVFHATCALLAVLGLCMFGLSRWQKTLRTASYDVHENGITQIVGQDRQYLPYTEIQDLYLFSSGQTVLSGLITNLAYRRNDSEPFIRVNEHLKGFQAFLQLVRERYLEARMPGALETLEAGGAVIFNYVGTGQVWRKRISGNFLKVTTQTIVVSRDALEVQGRRVPMGSLRSVDLNAWSENVVIRDEAGKTVLATAGTGIMSHDLFLTLLRVLLNSRQAQEAVA
jgi:hypothetical protein